jgi:peptide/nickel transport system permease protein
MVRRIIYMIPTLLIISVVSFAIIELPPGDYLDSYEDAMLQSGNTVSREELESIAQRYGLNQPFYTKYLKWMWGVLHGDFGQSFEWNKPVTMLLRERLPLTLLVSFTTLIFTYAVGIAIGIYTATHQYSLGDYVWSFVGFIGLATPNFLLALVLMFVFYRFFGLSIGGLFSVEYLDAPWSFGKVLDLINHMWIPVIVIGTAGTCGLIRVMRGTLLDELSKQYVVTARAKGVANVRLLFRYPVRVAINPIISTIGWTLPSIFSGATLTSIVLSLPTTGPLLLRSLLSQDMYLAGSFVFILAVLTVIGTLISDVLLAAVDPRIRMERRARA